MEFGKLGDIQLINWTLPPDDPFNEQRISGASKTNLYLGAPAWGCKDWKGKIYPAQSKPEEFLYHYSRKFNCIELNTTHYRMPSVQTGLDWSSQVPSKFLFCPKIPKQISHAKSDFIDSQLFKDWFVFLESLKNNLGPCFIQFHESFSYRYKSILFNILQNWPREFKLSLELRHHSWFQQNKLLPALADYLHKKKYWSRHH